VHVDDSNTTGTEDGTTSYPFRSIQDAIDLVADGGTVKVARGTYQENLSFSGRSATVLGGYVGGTYPGTGDFSEATRNANPATNQTIIDGGGSARQVRALDAGGKGSTVSGFKLRNSGAICGGGIVLRDVISTD
jgi:hypothetical protein